VVIVLARRMLVIALILMGLSVLAVSVEPPREPVQEGATTPRRGPTAQPLEERSRTISADEHGQRVIAELGRPLHLEVTASRPGSVQVGEDGPIAAVQPESPARFDLLPDRAGAQEIVLLDPPRAIGRLVVRR
jgi:hypothetical protein